MLTVLKHFWIVPNFVPNYQISYERKKYSLLSFSLLVLRPRYSSNIAAIEQFQQFQSRWWISRLWLEFDTGGRCWQNMNIYYSSYCYYHLTYANDYCIIFREIKVLNAYIWTRKMIHFDWRINRSKFKLGWMNAPTIRNTIAFRFKLRSKLYCLISAKTFYYCLFW